MIDWAEFVKEAAGLFAIIDPIGSVGLFLGLTGGQSDAQKKRTALVAAASMALVLVVSVALGGQLLSFFGVSIASFQVGGGILIFLIAIAMLKAHVPEIKRTLEEEKEAEDMDTVAVVPLAIPLLAGPGAISTVIIHSHNAATAVEYGALVAIILLIALITLATFRSAVPIASHLGKTGINIVTRLMGLLLAAISVEIISAGLKTLFPGLA